MAKEGFELQALRLSYTTWSMTPETGGPETWDSQTGLGISQSGLHAGRDGFASNQPTTSLRDAQQVLPQ